jgi:hypothetical protein
MTMKKIEIMAEKIKKEMATTKDITALSAKMNAKIDTSLVTFSGFGRSNIGRESELVGKLFTSKQGELLGPLVGNYAAYLVIINEIIEAPAKEDFSYEKMQQMQNFNQRVTGTLYTALEKTAKITDNRIKFY